MNEELEEIFQKESNKIIVRLLEIDKNKTIVSKYIHELVHELINKKYKKFYVDILYLVINKIPYPLTVTIDPIFHFESHKEFIYKRQKFQQLSIYDK